MPVFTQADRDLMVAACAGLVLVPDVGWMEDGPDGRPVPVTVECVQGEDARHPIDDPPHFGMMMVDDPGDPENGPCPYEYWEAARADGLTVRRAHTLGLVPLDSWEAEWRAYAYGGSES